MKALHVGALVGAAALGFASPASAAPPAPDPWLGRDKAWHFMACSILSGGAYGVTSAITPSTAWRVGVGAGVGIGAGAGKELVDLAGLGDPSWKDFAWDVAGTALGVGIALSIDYATRRPSKR